MQEFKKESLIPYQEYSQIWFHGTQVLQISMARKYHFIWKDFWANNCQYAMTNTAKRVITFFLFNFLL